MTAFSKIMLIMSIAATIGASVFTVVTYPTVGAINVAVFLAVWLGVSAIWGITLLFSGD